jgi:lipopolysaccharide/colanic/teichoic acid biosynthesis glycosyltransferase
MSDADRVIKRVFDVLMAGVGLAVLWPIIMTAWALASQDTGASGFYRQERIGRFGRLFKVVKLRTMRPENGTTVTTANDARITAMGQRLRRWKLDELPQLWNVLIGDMSFVGPRPDVPGFLDKLTGEDRALLTLRPGITGPASLKYRDEEQILAQVGEPERYNAEVIWPDKVRINLEYLRNWSLGKDLGFIIKTVLG